MYCVPKKSRTKLDVCSRVDIFLGTADRSNEAYIDMRSGNVVKSQSLSRGVRENKWDSDNILRVTGSPLQLCPDALGNKDAEWIEAKLTHMPGL